MSYNFQIWRPPQARWAPLQIMNRHWHRAPLLLQQTLLDPGEQEAQVCFEGQVLQKAFEIL